MDAAHRSVRRAAGVGGALLMLAPAACAGHTPSPTSAGTIRSTLGAAPSSPTTAGPTKASISCTATVSNPTPKRGMPTHVIVQTVSGAQVIVATTSTSSAMVVPKSAVSADADGRADLTVIPQTAGTKIALHVEATSAGATALCATSVTPVDLPRVSDSPGLPPIQITTQPIPSANAAG